MRKGRVVALEDGRQAVQLTLPFDPVLRLDEMLESLIADIGVSVMSSLLEDEAETKAGAKHAKRDGHAAVRHGYDAGSVVIAGQKRAILKPRLRADGKEVPLVRYGLFQSPRRMRSAVSRRILAKVSTRRYAEAVDEVAGSFGIQKSSVSRHWRAASAEELNALLSRRLDGLDLCAVLIDGVYFQDVVEVVALGISSDGRKHVLGLWEGSTENATTVTALLTDLRDRGLPTGKPTLFILDGGKALHAGVRAVFGEHAVIQRCLAHKKRNVLDHLPKNLHRMASLRISAAWGMNSYEDAKKALTETQTWLEGVSLHAAKSLEEGFEETLTLHRLGVDPHLRARLNTTNAIENLFGNLGDQVRRVKNWNSGPDMRRRWAAAMVLDAERRFHKLKNSALLVDLINRLANADLKTMIA
jgi:transposase-like protein